MSPLRENRWEDAAAFRRMRYGLGLLGFLLPFLLALSGRLVDGVVQPTISDVFHTTQRDLLVGGLSVIGVFLAVHRGWRRHPGRWVSPDLIVILAGIAAMGVAFFPNESTEVVTMSQKVLGLTFAPVLHYAAALLLYLMMSLTCFLIYAPDAEGVERRFYLLMGRVIFASGVMVMVLSGIKNNTDGTFARLIIAHNLVFWDESLGVWAFSVSWLVKAWRDEARRKARAWHRGDTRARPNGVWPTRPGNGPHPYDGSGLPLADRPMNAVKGLLAPPRPVRPTGLPVQIEARNRHRRVVDQSAPKPMATGDRGRRRA